MKSNSIFPVDEEGLDELAEKINEIWEEALANWGHPTIPPVIISKSQKDILKLGEIGKSLKSELAFMKYPESQTYMNLERIDSEFSEDPTKGLKGVSKHEIGHRFCPYDIVTLILLNHAVKKELEKEKMPYNIENISNLICNLSTDMCINTRLANQKDADITWVYQQLSKGKDSKLWHVYGRSMELAWRQKILPEEMHLSDKEERAAQDISDLFKGDFFNKANWIKNIKNYARLIFPFLEEEQKDIKTMLDDAVSNIPQEIDEKTEQEIAKRLAEIGSNGLPTNPSGLKEFKEIMAGFGKGDSKKASIAFYDLLSESYNILFASMPFGRPRVNPFQPVKWSPSMSADKLDVNYSIHVGGKIIPGVNTYSWKTRKREAFGGLEEVIPNLDLYLDSSMSMPDPLETISLPVLACFVAAKKAHRRGAKIRATNFSGDGQNKTQEWTRDLNLIFEIFVEYFNGGTIFPSAKLIEDKGPKQALIVTDAMLFNEQETVAAIKDLRNAHKSNNITIYSIGLINNADYLKNAGAQVIHGTTTDIFRGIIGKADEVYSK